MSQGNQFRSCTGCKGPPVWVWVWRGDQNASLAQTMKSQAEFKNGQYLGARCGCVWGGEGSVEGSKKQHLVGHVWWWWRWGWRGGGGLW